MTMQHETKGDVPWQLAVEIGGQGQQFVAYGIHPSTGKPFTWTNAAVACEPLAMRQDTLPEVTPDKLREFARRLAERMAELGYQDITVSDPGDPTRRAAYTAARRAEKVPVSPEQVTEVRAASGLDPATREGW